MKRQRTVKIQATKKEIKIAEKKEFDPVSFLSGLKIKDQEIISRDEAKMLLDLRNKYGKPMINVNQHTEIFELLTRIRIQGFQSVYGELTEKPYVDIQNYFFDTMEPQKRHFVAKTLGGLIVDKMEQGVFKCPDCIKAGRDPTQTQSIPKYTRGDEPPVSTVTCKLCGKQWKER